MDPKKMRVTARATPLHHRAMIQSFLSGRPKRRQRRIMTVSRMIRRVGIVSSRLRVIRVWLTVIQPQVVVPRNNRRNCGPSPSGPIGWFASWPQSAPARPAAASPKSAVRQARRAGIPQPRATPWDWRRPEIVLPCRGNVTRISHHQLESSTGRSAGLGPALGVRGRKAGFKPALLRPFRLLPGATQYSQGVALG